MLENRHKHPTHAPRVRTVLHDILDRAQLSKTTRDKYRVVLDQWVLFAGADPSGWTRARMSEWRDELIRRECSQETIKTYLASLRYVAKWWSSTHGGIDFTIIQPIDLPTEPSKKRHALVPEQAIKLLETCLDRRPNLFDHRDLAMLIVGLDTGMRRGSLAGMEWNKIGMLSRGPNGLYESADVPVKGRRGIQRWKVPLSDTALYALDSWRARAGAPSGPVFPRILRRGPTLTRDALSGTAIYNMVTARAKRAGIGHAHPHLLRHTFVSWRIENHVDYWIIASVTGHSVGGIADFKSEARNHGLVGNVERYVDLELAGAEGRKTTPAWFAQLARGLLKRFE